MTIELLVLIWVVCGVIAAGLAFAYFQRNWPRLAKKDRRKDAVSALCGVALGVPALAGMLLFLVSELGWKRMFKYGWVFPTC